MVNHRGAHGHLEGELPWATCQEALRPLVAKLVGEWTRTSDPGFERTKFSLFQSEGAKFDEVDIMNFLTVNLHVLMASFLQEQLWKL